MRERYLNRKSFEAILNGSCRFVVVSAKTGDQPKRGDSIMIREIDADNPDPAGQENTLLSGNLLIGEVTWVEVMPAVDKWHVCALDLTHYRLPYLTTEAELEAMGQELPQA